MSVLESRLRDSLAIHKLRLVVDMGSLAEVIHLGAHVERIALLITEG